MNRERADEVGRKLQAMMRAFAFEHGMQVLKTAVRYDETGLRFSAEVSEMGDDGNALRSERDFKAIARLIGLTPDDFGRTFTMRGRAYTVCGVMPKARRQPVLAKCADDGKTYRFEGGQVAMYLHANGSPAAVSA